MRKKKRSAVKITILVIVVLVAVALGAFAYYLYDKVNSGLFFKDTKINGYDVSGKTCKVSAADAEEATMRLRR